jgi:hypothetical protein
MRAVVIEVLEMLRKGMLMVWSCERMKYIISPQSNGCRLRRRNWGGCGSTGPVTFVKVQPTTSWKTAVFDPQGNSSSLKLVGVLHPHGVDKLLECDVFLHIAHHLLSLMACNS